MKIKKIDISGFKSIDKLSLTDLNHFMVFAGPNGSGKSNLFDAFKFISFFLNYGLQYAMQSYGGFEYIHCYKKRNAAARTFKFEITVCDDDASETSYSLTISHMDKDPLISEIYTDRQSHIVRNAGEFIIKSENKEDQTTLNFPPQSSILSGINKNPISQLLSLIRLFRIDPVLAKNSSPNNLFGNVLDVNGQNIAKVLTELEKDDNFRDEINEWMSLFVPHLSDVATEQQRLEPKTTLTFKEEGLRKRFPANLISDGTIYLLCILTAILHPPCQYGITLIEEPERGINPKPIEALIGLLRQSANGNHFIFVTTHNETVVRSAQAEELAFLYKKDGRTQIKWGRESKDVVKGVPLDTAWLSNMFDGGLPW